MRRIPILLLLWASAALAQPYPARPVKIMAGASPGGGIDIISRLLADKFAERFKQPFVVENRPGASNTLAADFTARAAPDGHTLMVATNTGQAIAPHLIKLGFDAQKDIQPVGLVVVVPNVVVVNTGVPARTIDELLALLKAKPGEYRFASVGVGSTQHIAAELFMRATGTKLIHIPYKGSSQAHIDLLGGQVEMMLDTTSSAMGQIKAGRLRPLAVTTPKRAAELPEVPTLAESGVQGVEMSTWYGLFATGGTPRPIVERLNAELQKALKLPDVQARLAGLGGEPGALRVQQFTEMNTAEYERFGRLIREAAIRIEGQPFEMQASAIRVLGWVDDPDTYPIQPKAHTLEFLREVAHLRPRTNVIAAAARVRHTVAQAIHRFFHERDFFWVNTPIITASDAEGAGELRSEEHTSELQSPCNLVCRLLLEKKKK